MLTLLCGIGGLIGIATYLRLPDWDVGISVLMPIFTYLFAPLTIANIRVALRNPSRTSALYAVGGLILAWFVVDALYVGYSLLNKHPYFRKENLILSCPLYFMGGMLWSYERPTGKS